MSGRRKQIRTGSDVTVVIPTFNRAHFLASAINSCLEQTYPCEVIVVDHGSTDKTPEVTNEFGLRIKYVRRELDSGPEFAWMDGLLRVETEFAKILHDDDWLEPTFLERCMKEIGDDTGFVFTNAAIVTEDGTRIRSALEPGFAKLLRSQNRISTKRMSRFLLSPSQMLFRTQDLIDGMYLGKLPFQEHNYLGAGSDHYMKLLAMSRYKGWHFVQDELVSFRAHAGSITVNATTDDSRDLSLTSTYRDVHDFYLMLKWMKLVRFKQILKLRRRLDRKVRHVWSFGVRLSRQIRRYGIIPLRYQQTPTK